MKKIREEAGLTKKDIAEILEIHFFVYIGIDSDRSTWQLNLKIKNRTAQK